MADDVKWSLIYVSRLSQSEKGEVYSLADVWPEADLRARLRQAVEDVCVDRLVRAEGCLGAAKSLMSVPAPSVEELRTAVGRAYYSIHHAIRAMCLRRNHWDPDGHGESIEQIRKLLNAPDFQRAFGLMPGIVKEISEARDNREVADYSPYNFSRRTEGIGIFSVTGLDWRTAADFNIGLAERLLTAADKVIFL